MKQVWLYFIIIVAAIFGSHWLFKQLVVKTTD